jgi:hypothetical protein
MICELHKCKMKKVEYPGEPTEWVCEQCEIEWTEECGFLCPVCGEETCDCSPEDKQYADRHYR